MLEVANLGLAARLALRSLLHRRVLSVATLLGVAIGMSVVDSILIVDHNSARTRAQLERLERQGYPGAVAGGVDGPALLSVHFVRRGVKGELARATPSPLPTQEGEAPAALPLDDSRLVPRGEEDYQAMRLAVRLASMLAFSVGAVIVFYTMRFSLAARSREFSLLLCLGEHRGNVALSLGLQALFFGVAGTATGLLLAFPFASALLGLRISTTGRIPLGSFRVPEEELLAMAGIGVAVALLGVVGPVRNLYRLRVVDVLQPRFLSPDVDERNFHVRGFGWLFPALLAAAYLSFRPFLASWLSVVQFFVVETIAVGVLALAVLSAIPHVLRAVIRAFEAVLQPILPLEVLLVGRRMRLTSQKVVFTIAGVAMVFSLLTALHCVTRSLKDEVRAWTDEASRPYAYFRRRQGQVVDERALRASLERGGIRLFRMSEKLPGEFPVRLVRAADLNPHRAEQGRPPFGPGAVILSRTLAARFDVAAGDAVVIRSPSRLHDFEILEVADDVGFYAEGRPYVDLKSYALMSDGNPLFAGLERTLGDYAIARSADASQTDLDPAQLRALSRFYEFEGAGARQGKGQVREIDRDFLIFDFILLMTVLLAAIGVANHMLIQVHARQRELSVLRTIGIGHSECTRLLVAEGVLVGLVGATLALGLGNAVGALSVAFLDRFTLFEYAFRFSPQASLAVSALAILTCAVAAIYPARVATSQSSAESLHYE